MKKFKRRVIAQYDYTYADEPRKTGYAVVQETGDGFRKTFWSKCWLLCYIVSKFKGGK